MHVLLHHGGLALATLKAVEGIDEARRCKFLILACLLAAVVHDFEHNGVSNDFHIKSLSEKAVTYNDKSVNEHHHVSAAFRVLLKPECNFLESMCKEEFRILRSLMVDLILATDMSEHGRLLEAFKEASSSASKSSDGVYVPTSRDAALLSLKIVLKCSDLGHLALNWGAHLRWVLRLEEEFYRQGDLEKKAELNVSFLMDREKPGVSQSQIGFFEYMVLPLYRTFQKAFPSVTPMVASVEANYEQWRVVQEERDAEGPVKA